MHLIGVVAQAPGCVVIAIKDVTRLDEGPCVSFQELCELNADTPVSSGFDQASNSSGPEPGTSTPLDGGAQTEMTWKASSSRGRYTSSRQQVSN